jgi:hypothetical protein
MATIINNQNSINFTSDGSVTNSKITGFSDKITIEGSSLSTAILSGVSDPLSDNDVSNKTFVLKKKWKDAVITATTINITLSNLQTVDDVSLQAEDRVLVKDQSTASQNGIYVVVDGGSWTRSDDSKLAYPALGSSVLVSEGTVNNGTFWFCNSGETFGSSPIFVILSAIPVLPAPSVTYAQYNNSGSFGGSVDLTYVLASDNVIKICGEVSSEDSILNIATDISHSGSINIGGIISGPNLTNTSTVTLTPTNGSRLNINGSDIMTGTVFQANTTQSIPQNSYTTVGYNSTIWTNGTNNPTRSGGTITINETGFYQISYVVRDANNALNWMMGKINKSGSAVEYLHSEVWPITSPTTSVPGIASTGVLSFTDGDTFTFQVSLNSLTAGNVNISSSNQPTNLTILKIAGPSS